MEQHKGLFGERVDWAGDAGLQAALARGDHHGQLSQRPLRGYQKNSFQFVTAAAYSLR